MREQEFGWEPLGPGMVTELQASLDADNRIVSWNHEVWRTNSASPALRSTAGMTDIVRAALRRWLTTVPDQIVSGIASPRMSAAISSLWHWRFLELSPRQLAVRFTDVQKYFISEASVYRLFKAHDLITSPAYVVIKAANEFKDKTTAINQLWQTDFTYLKITGWGWYYLSTVLDDFSRYIVAWKLCATMCADDVTATLDLALSAAGLDHVTVVHRPRLLSDNGSSYVAGDLARWLQDKGMEHVRGAPYHPQTQGKIERWHQTLKNRILLNNYYLPGDLERQIDAFVEHYNHVRYHESINNLTPADVYFGRAETILAERQRIKRATIANRRLQHQLQAA